MQNEEHISLYYRDGSSDKRYDVTLRAEGDLWVVNFAYGRRGATLKPGTKTSQPVDYAKARKIYDKLVSSKTADGYTPGEGGTPFQGSPKGDRVSGFAPQLPNPIEEDELAGFIDDPRWILQEKSDGERRMIRKDAAGIVGINRKGLTVALPASLEAAAAAIADDFVIDGEVMGDRLVAFDILFHYETDTRGLPYGERLELLASIVADAAGSGPGNEITLPPCGRSSTEKKALLDALRAANAEGVVLKRLDAPYVAGRPASAGSQLKFKFYATLSAIVVKVNDKRSVAVGLVDGASSVPVGNVTVPPNFDMPAPGQVVEIRYLYAYKGGSLYQPTYLGPRGDIDPDECDIGQLKFKSE